MNNLLEIKVTSHPRYHFYLGLGVIVGSLAMSAATQSLQDSLWEEISFATISGGKQLSSFNAAAVWGTSAVPIFPWPPLISLNSKKKKSKKLRMEKATLLDPRPGSVIDTELKL